MNFSKKTVFKDRSECVPKHVAIIMDGNGRWAKRRMLERLEGHEKGAGVAKEIVMSCSEMGVSVLTLYAFSTENWQRSKIEINGLMQILLNFLKEQRFFFSKRDVKLNVIGQLYRLPLAVREALSYAIRSTSKNKGMCLNLALSYGGRADISNMVSSIAVEVKKGSIDPKLITSRLISRYLSTYDLPDPDLLIRTGGEMRLSNFLLWQIAYTEIFFTETLWPDFGTMELIRILNNFLKRNRRFGLVTT